jgi:hypothetical protein
MIASAAIRWAAAKYACGRSSGVEHNLAKVGVESSNLFARSISFLKAQRAMAPPLAPA